MRVVLQPDGTITKDDTPQGFTPAPRTKDRVREYRRQHPDSTVREIQSALGISSPSVVQFHLENDARVDEIKALRSALLMVRTPFASTLRHEEALERLREINQTTYAALGDDGR